MIIVKPRLKKSIEGMWFLLVKENYSLNGVFFLAIIKKKKDLESREGEEQLSPQLTKTDGRFETYTGKNNSSFQSRID